MKIGLPSPNIVYTNIELLTVFPMVAVRLVMALPRYDPHRAEHGAVQHGTHFERTCTKIYI